MTVFRSEDEVRARLSEIVDLVESKHERVVITRDDKAAAVVVSATDLKGLEEKLEALSTRHVRDSIATAEAEIAAGTFVSAAELRTKYLGAK